MLDDKSQAEIAPHATVTQIIVLTLFGGVLIFGAVVLFMPADDRDGKLEILSLISIGMAVMSVFMSFLVPKLIVKTNRNKIANGDWSGDATSGTVHGTDGGKLSAVFQMTTIVGSALLEGAAFFALVAYMQEGHFAALVVVAVLMLGILFHFPTRSRIEGWVEAQLRLIDEERNLSRNSFQINRDPNR